MCELAMQSIRQTWRPKHQMLVLQCYPRTAKDAADAKANASELSYLLFYAQSRRTKMAKVGAFLAKKTASDVTRQRIGNVRVTLEILTALVAKAPKDVALIAASILRVLEQVVEANNSMAAAAMPLLAAFCSAHDTTTLLGDQALAGPYGGVVEKYARLASTWDLGPSEAAQQQRRKTGLAAIRCVAAADALSPTAPGLYDEVVAVVLENLWTADAALRAALRQQADVPNGATAVPAGDEDQLAEADVGGLALQCLQHIFAAPSRSQIAAATAALLRFVAGRVADHEDVLRTVDGTDAGWATCLFDLVARWAPAHDRFAVLATAMDTLVQTPMEDGHLPHQTAVVAMVGSLLRSDQAMAGLGVMDVLGQLTAHMWRLVCMPGSSEPRRRLLERLQQCIGDLATHVYYADQIADMVGALLLGLRALPAARDPLVLPAAAALAAVKSILDVAKAPGLARSRVPVRVWDGTHRLLGDADGPVRKAYAAALVAWLDGETGLTDDTVPLPVTASPGLMRRRLSSAATRLNEPASLSRARFVQLVHVAIYDNALHFVDDEADMVLLHVLLAKLVERLGMDAVRHGLPMVLRLQEAIPDAETPLRKVRLGSLVHGYLWVLTERFGLQASPAGRAIHAEIRRRRHKRFWVDGLGVPPPLIEHVATPGEARPDPTMRVEDLASEALLPFDDRLALVERLCAAAPAAVALLLRDEMRAEWSRHTVLAAVQAATKSESLSGSRAATTRTRLAVHACGPVSGAANGHAMPPSRSPSLRPSTAPALPGPASGMDRPGPSGAGGTFVIASVEQLKLVLSGRLEPQLVTNYAPADADESGAESTTPSDLSSAPLPPAAPTSWSDKPADTSDPTPQPASAWETTGSGGGGGGGPLNSHPFNTDEATDGADEHDDEVQADIPPVPQIPSAFEGERTLAVEASPVLPSRLSSRHELARQPPHAATLPMHRPSTASKRSVRSAFAGLGLGFGAGGLTASSTWSHSVRKDGAAIDLDAMLKGIDSFAGPETSSSAALDGGDAETGVVRPPY